MGALPLPEKISRRSIFSTSPVNGGGKNEFAFDLDTALFTLGPMAKDFIGYEALVESALRGVVREALRKVESQGLIGGHHFFITFKTRAPGVEMPDFLREQYPEEITVVVQNKFWGLKAGDEAFEVTLTFQKVPASLRVPYAAITAFADPGTKFGLQFGAQSGKPPVAAGAKPPAAVTESTPVADEATQTENQVVSLDKFRKK